MPNVSSAGGVGLEGARIAAEYQARVTVTTKDAVKLQGDLALKLIESASIDPAVGGNLNLQI